MPVHAQKVILPTVLCVVSLLFLFGCSVLFEMLTPLPDWRTCPGLLLDLQLGMLLQVTRLNQICSAGIDPDGHVDFHELGMELCSEALEAVVSSEEAQPLFEAAASKFQEVVRIYVCTPGSFFDSVDYLPIEQEVCLQMD